MKDTTIMAILPNKSLKINFIKYSVFSLLTQKMTFTAIHKNKTIVEEYLDASSDKIVEDILKYDPMFIFTPTDMLAGTYLEDCYPIIKNKLYKLDKYDIVKRFFVCSKKAVFRNVLLKEKFSKKAVFNAVSNYFKNEKLTIEDVDFATMTLLGLSFIIPQLQVFSPDFLSVLYRMNLARHLGKLNSNVEIDTYTI